MGKENSDIIHAEGVRLALHHPGDARPCKVFSRQAFISRMSGPDAIGLPAGMGKSGIAPNSATLLKKAALRIAEMG